MAVGDYGQFDRKSAERIAAATRRVEGTQRNTIRGRRNGPADTTFYLGKPDTAFTAGVLTSPNNVVSIWKGPAWGTGDADTGQDVEVDYATADFAVTDYVAVTRYRGKWYVHCFVPTA